MKCDVWKPCSDQRWQDELRFLIWRFFEQSAFVNIYLLCYWPTVHNLISKSCPKIQVINSHFFKVNELLNEHWENIVQSENISTPIYVECDKIYRSKVCVQEFLYIVSGLDIQFEKSEYDSPVCQKNRLQVAKYDESYTVFFETLIRINGSVVKTGCSESDWVGRSRFDSSWVLKRSAAPGPFCVLSPSVHWHALFLYCCALYNSFFNWISSVAISRWQSCKS